jgi:hypothetical protein
MPDTSSRVCLKQWSHAAYWSTQVCQTVQKNTVAPRMTEQLKKDTEAVAQAALGPTYTV